MNVAELLLGHPLATDENKAERTGPKYHGSWTEQRQPAQIAEEAVKLAHDMRHLRMRVAARIHRRNAASSEER